MTPRTNTGALIVEPVSQVPPPRLDFTTVFAAMGDDDTGGANLQEVDDLMPLHGVCYL